MDASFLLIALPAILNVQSVLPVSEFSQADTEPRLLRTSVTVVRPYVASRDERADVELPPNLSVAPAYQEVVEAMRRVSPTFRQQCLRIANAPRLTVVVQGARVPLSNNARAFTRILRENGGRLHAVVQIGQLEPAAELIAHEVEHVIEQLDGIDLRAKAAMATTGVRRCQCGDVDVFETQWAVVVGLQVADELRERGR